MNGIDSIANMTKKTITPTPTRESRALAAAISDSGMTKAAIAEQIGVSPGLVSQWASGYRPIAPEHAPALGTLLRIDPASISNGFAKIVQTGAVVAIGGKSTPVGATSQQPVEDSDLAIARLQNDVHALTLALGSLTAVMVGHRPAEAQAVAAAMRRNVPAKYQDTGLIQQLLSMLDKAGPK